MKLTMRMDRYTRPVNSQSSYRPVQRANSLQAKRATSPVTSAKASWPSKLSDSERDRRVQGREVSVMSSRTLAASPGRPAEPTLEQGDHLDQKTFHELYEQTPENVKAELIEGVVYIPSPVRLQHAEVHAD